MVEPCLLDYRQAAEYLNIGKSTLYALVSEQQLTCVRFGAGKDQAGTDTRLQVLEKRLQRVLPVLTWSGCSRRRKRSTQITTKGMRFSGTSRL